MDLYQKKINELIDNLDKKDREKLLKLYLDNFNNTREKRGFWNKMLGNYSYSLTLAIVSLLD